MSASLVRSVGVLLGVLTTLLAQPMTATATVSGGCQVEGSADSGGTVDLTTATTWHLLSTDVAAGRGTAPTDQTAAGVSVYALGLALPVATGNGNGERVGAVAGRAVSTFAVLGRRFVIAGSSDSCSGQVEIIIEDVNPLLTVLGGGGLAASLVGLLLLYAASRMAGGDARTLGLLAGALAGLGVSLALEQFGVLDPRAPLGLAIVVALALVGLLIAGRQALGRGAGAADPR